MGPVIRQYCSSDVNYADVCDLLIAEEDEEEETPPPQPEVEAEKEKPEEKQDEEGTEHTSCTVSCQSCYFTITDLLSSFSFIFLITFLYFLFSFQMWF